ncbi:MAG: hypothetical protein V3R58_00065, partial [candidate division NC10 bacterium]
MKERVLRTLVVLIAGISWTAACTPETDYLVQVMRLAPGDAETMVLAMDIEALAEDPDMRVTYEDTLRAAGWHVPGMDATAISAIAQIQAANVHASVLTGDFDLEAVRDALIDEDYVEGEYRGIETWTDDYKNTVAFVDNMIIADNSEDVEACIRLYGDEGYSMYDNEDVKAVADKLPAAPIRVVFSSGSNDGIEYLSNGFSMGKEHPDDETLHVSIWFKFDSEASAEAALGEGIEDSVGMWLNATVTDARRNGQFIEIAGETEIPEPSDGGESEAAETELANIQAATIALMVDNGLSSLPNPVVVPTNDMSAFPDGSTIASGDKAFDASGNAYVDGVDPLGDKDGFLLFGHDRVADNDQATLANYVATTTTTGTYTVTADGTVTQVTTVDDLSEAQRRISSLENDITVLRDEATALASQLATAETTIALLKAVRGGVAVLPTPSAALSKDYSKYAFGFDYPYAQSFYSVAEMGILESEANYASGIVQVTREYSFYRKLFQVAWINITSSAWAESGGLEQMADDVFPLIWGESASVVRREPLVISFEGVEIVDGDPHAGHAKAGHEMLL